MKYPLLLGLLLLMPFVVWGQNHKGITDGDFIFEDLAPIAFAMRSYDKDSAAHAVVLDEYGKTYIDNEQKNILVHYRHVCIKILDSRGTGQATFEIPIAKGGGGTEEVYNIKACTYNREGAITRRTDLKLREVFRKDRSRTEGVVTFTLPDVKEGSVLDVQYNLSSPYLRNFHSWDFQSDIPKRHSAYWAKIPANLVYHVSLTGYLKLDDQQRELERGCLVTFNGGKADCTVMKLGMRDIPAFREEPYMPAPSNYMAAVHFELSELKGFDGSVQRLTNSWKDLEARLTDDKDFGGQLKRGAAMLRPLTTVLTRDDTSALERARHLYGYFQHAYKWDRYVGVFCEKGIKKLMDDKQGDIADINLALVAGLRSLGLAADPVLVSTRDHGIPHDLYPAVTDFNYVLAQLRLEGATYLLDAARPGTPFGLVPLDCINGRGRILYEDKPSAWISLQATEGFLETDLANLALKADGTLSGTMVRTYTGYRALSKREEIAQYNSPADYRNHVSGQWPGFTVTADTVLPVREGGRAFSENLAFTAEGAAGGQLVVRPFFASLQHNPFQASERHYPLSFGAPDETQLTVSLRYPDSYRLVSMPKPIHLALPDQGGEYILQTDSLQGLIVLRTRLRRNKPLYSPAEYGALKKFYDLVIQAQRAELVFEKQ